MPVSLLLCEGQAGSPDARVLRSILRGVPIRVLPAGSKYGLSARVQAYREASPASVVAGIRDSDFDRDFQAPADRARPWRIENERQWLGWYWERTEIENYLLDPLVVTRAVSPEQLARIDYQSALDEASGALTEYTAARTALSRSRGRYEPLPNAWGVSAGLRAHVLPLPCSEADCRGKIEQIVQLHVSKLQVPVVLERYN